ncbi:MAG: SUMF1/EgtB/PvdO family nonheme iron enzyme [Verrucomicrobiota bacterium]
MQNFARTVARHWVWVVSLLAFIGLLAANLHFSQPDAAARANQTPTLSPKDPTVKQLAAEIAALEKAYRNALTGASTPPPPGALAALKEAAQKQRQLIRLIAGADEQQVALQHRLDTEIENFRVQNLLPQIVRLTAEGEAALAAGRLAEADPPLREALRLQHEVNASGAEIGLKSNGRESKLQLDLAQIEAETVHLELEAALAEAHTAAAAGRVPAAIVSFNRARTLQGRINRDYPATPYASTHAADLIAAEIESFGAAGLRAQSEESERTGAAALASGRDAEATEAFQLAREAQLGINEKFPRGEFVSTDRADKLEAQRQTAASGPTATLLATLDRAIADLVRQRRPVEAAQKIAEAARTADRLFSNFPKSDRRDPALKAKTDYLAARRSDLPEIQRLAYAGLLRLPGATDRALFKTEVTQTLYQLVSGTNPSRNLAPTRPVDSVSWHEAHTFCIQLSWLLGVTVRLPTEAEFRAALGPTPQPTVWSRDNSSGSTQPVARQPANAAGFSDLLGNVAEWLDAAEPAADAPTAGGSYQDAAAALVKIPIDLRAKNDRVRHIGFRFLAESADLPLTSLGTTPPMSNSAGEAQPAR